MVDVAPVRGRSQVRSFSRWAGRAVLTSGPPFSRSLRPMATHIPNPAEIKRDWLLVDLEGQTVGRAAS